MTEPNDQAPTMAGKQSRVGSQPSSDPRVSGFDDSTSSNGGGISRVKFSTDTERLGSSAPEPIAGRGMLTIDTSGSSPKEESSEIRSLDRLGDNSATNSTAETRTPVLHHSSTSPTSPRKRNRGYSLRRQVLFRNVHDQTGEDAGVAHSSANDMGIELTSTPEISILADSRSKGTDLLHREATDRDRTARKYTLSSVAGSLPHYTVWAKKQSYTLEGQIRLYFKNARNFLLQISEIPPNREGRKIPLGSGRKTPLIDGKTGKEYMNNTIRSSRYTIWSFFPKQLFAQFSKLANL